MRARTRRALVIVAAATCLAALGSVAWFARHVTSPHTLARSPLEFELARGASLRSAGRQLAAQGALPDAWTFVLLGRVLGKAGAIKAGNYEVRGAVSPHDLLLKITEGDYSQASITLLEGWNSRQVRRALNEHPALRHDSEPMSEAQILEALEIREASPEGLFFPDTYVFSKGASDLAVLRRAHEAMRKHLDAAWSGRAGDLPLSTPYEALILASIVEKETGVAAERAMIAGVFVNRLRIGMPLQTDPTVIYGLGESFDGNLRKRDLQADHAFNTYTRAGLPPTPIAMPGLESLRAAVQPARTRALYFVARGDGTSEFSETLDQHNRAVSKYQKKRRN